MKGIVFIQPTTLSLLIRAFILLTFKVIVDNYVLIFIFVLLKDVKAVSLAEKKAEKARQMTIKGIIHKLPSGIF